MNASATDPGAEPAADDDEVDDPNCLLPPLGPERKQLYGLVNKLSNVGCALVSTLIRVFRGLEPLPATLRGSPLRALERANRAACLAIALMLRVRHGIVVEARPAALPKEMDVKAMRKRVPAAGVGLPRIEPDAATMIERMTDAQALARIRRDMTFAAKVFGYSDIVAQVTALANEAEALLARPPAPPAPPLPPARRAEAEVQRRRAARAASAAGSDTHEQRRRARRVAAAAASEGSSVAYAAAMPPLPPDSG